MWTFSIFLNPIILRCTIRGCFGYFPPLVVTDSQSIFMILSKKCLTLRVYMFINLVTRHKFATQRTCQFTRWCIPEKWSYGSNPTSIACSLFDCTDLLALFICHWESPGSASIRRAAFSCLGLHNGLYMLSHKPARPRGMEYHTGVGVKQAAYLFLILRGGI